MKKIIKIITAIGNKNLNNILRNEKNFEILEKDIFYKEGILEFLEKNKKVDILILYEKLQGEINILSLVKKIKKVNNGINIIFILEKKNKELEKKLESENIKNIFYNDEINIEEFIIKIKKFKKNNEEDLINEIKELKKIINKKELEILEYKKIFFEKENNNNKLCKTELTNNCAKLLKNTPNKKIIKIENNQKIEIIITTIKKYSINKKIEKKVLKNKL